MKARQYMSNIRKVQEQQPRFDQECSVSRHVQHTFGRAESVLKIGLLAGLAIAQTAKIFAKIAANIMTLGAFIAEDHRSISLKSMARDTVVLTAIFQRIFNDGICGVIFAPRAHSQDIADTAKDGFRIVFLGNYHYRFHVSSSALQHNSLVKEEKLVSELFKEAVIDSQPSLGELVTDYVPVKDRPVGIAIPVEETRIYDARIPAQINPNVYANGF